VKVPIFGWSSAIRLYLRYLRLIFVWWALRGSDNPEHEELARLEIKNFALRSRLAQREYRERVEAHRRLHLALDRLDRMKRYRKERAQGR